jgi:hypothetical protein
MPATQKAAGSFVGVNVATPIDGMNPAIVSVRMWLWPSVTDQSAPTTASLAHFIEFEGYDARNAGGSSVFARSSMDTAPRTCLQVFEQSGLEALLRAAFPPPTAD